MLAQTLVFVTPEIPSTNTTGNNADGFLEAYVTRVELLFSFNDSDVGYSRALVEVQQHFRPDRPLPKGVPTVSNNPSTPAIIHSVLHT